MYGNESAKRPILTMRVPYFMRSRGTEKSSFRLSRISLERSVGLEKPPRETLATCQRENTNELPGNEATLIVNVNQLMKDTIAHAEASHIHRSRGKRKMFTSIVQMKTQSTANCCKKYAVTNVTLILC